MSRKSIRFSSLKALREHAASGALMQNRHRVIDYVAEAGPCSRVEISKATGVSINSVAGRVNEAIHEGILTDLGPPKECAVTGRVVHAVKLNPDYRGNEY